MCIDKHIVPALNQGNIVTFVKDAYAKLHSSQQQLGNGETQSEDIWYEFFNRCIQICAESIDFLVRDKDVELLEVPQTVVDEIFERALRI